MRARHLSRVPRQNRFQKDGLLNIGLPYPAIGRGSLATDGRGIDARVVAGSNAGAFQGIFHDRYHAVRRLSRRPLLRAHSRPGLPRAPRHRCGTRSQGRRHVPGRPSGRRSRLVDAGADRHRRRQDDRHAGLRRARPSVRRLPGLDRLDGAARQAARSGQADADGGAAVAARPEASPTPRDTRSRSPPSRRCSPARPMLWNFPPCRCCSAYRSSASRSPTSFWYRSSAPRSSAASIAATRWRSCACRAFCSSALPSRPSGMPRRGLPRGAGRRGRRAAEGNGHPSGPGGRR